MRAELAGRPTCVSGAWLSEGPPRNAAELEYPPQVTSLPGLMSAHTHDGQAKRSHHSLQTPRCAVRA